MATLAAQPVNAPPHATTRTEAAPTDMRGFLTILARHLRAIVLTTLTSLALALAYLAIASPVYTASTTLFIDPRLKKVVSDEVTQGSLGSDLALVESQVAIIGSDAVLKRVVDKLKLDDDAEFAPMQGAGLLSRLKALVVTRPTAPDPKLKALENLARGIKVKRAQKTYVVDVEASASTPVKAARIANAVADALDCPMPPPADHPAPHGRLALPRVVQPEPAVAHLVTVVAVRSPGGLERRPVLALEPGVRTDHVAP